MLHRLATDLKHLLFGYLGGINRNRSPSAPPRVEAMTLHEITHGSVSQPADRLRDDRIGDVLTAMPRLVDWATIGFMDLVACYNPCATVRTRYIDASLLNQENERSRDDDTLARNLCYCRSLDCPMILGPMNKDVEEFDSADEISQFTGSYPRDKGTRCCPLCGTTRLRTDLFEVLTLLGARGCGYRRSHRRA